MEEVGGNVDFRLEFSKVGRLEVWGDGRGLGILVRVIEEMIYGFRLDREVKLKGFDRVRESD